MTDIFGNTCDGSDGYIFISSGDGKVHLINADYLTEIENYTAPEIDPDEDDEANEADDSSPRRLPDYAGELWGFTDDDYNLWGYSPYSDKLNLFEQHAPNDEEDVRIEVSKIDFWDTHGDVEGCRAFIDQFKTMQFFDGHGDIPDGVKMYDTLDDARQAAKSDSGRLRFKSFRDPVLSRSICDEANSVAISDISRYRESAELELREIIDDLNWSLRYDFCEIALNEAKVFADVVYLYDGLASRESVDYAKRRWAVYEAGYLVFGDIDDVLYCYRHPQYQ